GRPVWARSPTPAVARSVRPTTAAATAASARWSRPTRRPSAPAWPSSAPRRSTWCASTAPSTPARLPSARRARPTSMSPREARPHERGGPDPHHPHGLSRPGRGRGRAFTEAPDLTARICGICPVAYQMSAVRAMEDACGVTIDEGPLRDLRRLLYCGEWIESHSLHVYMLHAPDFLGYPGAVEMARDHAGIVEQGLQMKKAGNALMAVVGGRE